MMFLPGVLCAVVTMSLGIAQMIDGGRSTARIQNSLLSLDAAISKKVTAAQKLSDDQLQASTMLDILLNHNFFSLSPDAAIESIKAPLHAAILNAMHSHKAIDAEKLPAYRKLLQQIVRDEAAFKVSDKRLKRVTAQYHMLLGTSGSSWRWLDWMLLISTLLFFAPIRVYLLWMSAHNRKIETRQKTNCCTTCGYSLTGNISGVCPECGSATMRGNMRSR